MCATRPGNVGIAPAALVVVGPDFSVLSVTIEDFPESVNSLSIGVAETVHQQVMMATGDGSAARRPSG